MPNDEITVTFRSANNVKNIPLGGWFTTDINMLCRKIVVKQIKINMKAGDFDKISDTISQQLLKLHQTQNLNLIGGFQSSNTTVEALFYKEDKAPAKALVLKMQNLWCAQWGSSPEQVTQINEQIQNIHLDDEGVLRCIISLSQAGSEQKYHILVFAVTEGDKDYTVMNFPEYLQE